MKGDAEHVPMQLPSNIQHARKLPPPVSARVCADDLLVFQENLRTHRHPKHARREREHNHVVWISSGPRGENDVGVEHHRH